MEPINDHAALIDALGGNTVVADFLASREDIDNCTPVRVGQWKIGGRIPVEYWPGIIEMASEKQVEGINSDWLMSTNRPRQRNSASEAA